MTSGISMQTKISPTNISSDLITPEQRDRLTIPSIGYQPVRPRPLGGFTWGENLTNYGGIGKLPFFGKRRVRDLYVSRSHRHFSSGFSTYETAVQPYQVTTLLNSECRLNDQVLPPTFTCTLDPVKYSSWISRTNNPYFSHTCKCEVLPRHDPNRKDQHGNNILSSATRNDLTDYYHQVYDEPRYQKELPNNTQLILDRLNDKLVQQRAAQEDNAKDKVPDQKVKDDKEREKEEVDDCTHSCDFKEVLDNMGSASKHCCLREILAKVLEYKGMESLREVIAHLFRIVPSPSLLETLKDKLGTNGAHIVAELVMLYHSIGTKAFTNILDSVQPRLRCARDIVKMTDEPHLRRNLNSFCHSCSASAQNHIDAIHSTNDPLLGYKQDQKVIKPNCEASVPGQTPCWPPGSCYCISKPWFAIKCIESFPYNPTLGYQLKTDATTIKAKNETPRTKVGILPGISAEESLRGASPKRVRFSDQNDRFYHLKEEEQDVKADYAIPENHTPGYPRYKKYLDDVLPVHLEYDKDVCQDPRQPVIPPDHEPVGRPPHIPSEEEYPSLVADDNVHLPPLAACLEPTGSRIQDHLGLKFKTQAHKQFHSLHPDSIPDLRDFRRFSKKYFFIGYHASVFRGGYNQGGKQQEIQA